MTGVQVLRAVGVARPRHRIGKSGQPGGLTIGDSTWDCEASRRLGLPSIAVRTGGFPPEELRAAGARDVHESLPELTAALLGQGSWGQWRDSSHLMPLTGFGALAGERRRPDG